MSENTHTPALQHVRAFARKTLIWCCEGIKSDHFCVHMSHVHFYFFRTQSLYCLREAILKLVVTVQDWSSTALGGETSIGEVINKTDQAIICATGMMDVRRYGQKRTQSDFNPIQRPVLLKRYSCRLSTVDIKECVRLTWCCVQQRRIPVPIQHWLKKAFIGDENDSAFIYVNSTKTMSWSFTARVL